MVNLYGINIGRRTRPLYLFCIVAKRKTAAEGLRFVPGKKEPTAEAVGFMLALPIFPGSRPPSIVGAYELNFCVRDGNRWTLAAINTNYLNTVYGIICFVVTHTGFEPMLTA